MATMTTSWNIFDASRQKENGLIIKIVYGCTVQLGKFIDRTTSELELIGDANSETFVPFIDLTHEIILQWVKTVLGQEQVTAIETSLQNSVTAQKTAKETAAIVNGLPWNNKKRNILL